MAETNTLSSFLAKVGVKMELQVKKLSGRLLWVNSHSSSTLAETSAQSSCWDGLEDALHGYVEDRVLVIDLRKLKGCAESQELAGMLVRRFEFQVFRLALLVETELRRNVLPDFARRCYDDCEMMLRGLAPSCFPWEVCALRQALRCGRSSERVATKNGGPVQIQKAREAVM